MRQINRKETRSAISDILLMLRDAIPEQVFIKFGTSFGIANVIKSVDFSVQSVMITLSVCLSVFGIVKKRSVGRKKCSRSKL
jgi:hypothetical protein